jgi:hypothetical protein
MKNNNYSRVYKKQLKNENGAELNPWKGKKVIHQGMERVWSLKNDCPNMLNLADPSH